MHACNFRHKSQELPDWPADKEKLHSLSTRGSTTIHGGATALDKWWWGVQKKATSISFSLLNMEKGSYTIFMQLGNWINWTSSSWTATTPMCSIICYMKMMFDKDIKVMTLEAHSSHFSQPLDKNPFSAFKHEFNFQMKWFNRSVGGRAITKQEFFPVFNTAWNRAMTAGNIKAGFKQTGIWPPDIEAIPDELFAICE